MFLKILISVNINYHTFNIFFETVRIPITALTTRKIYFLTLLAGNAMFAKQYNVAIWKGSRQASSHIPRNLQIINPQNTAIFFIIFNNKFVLEIDCREVYDDKILFSRSLLLGVHEEKCANFAQRKYFLASFLPGGPIVIIKMHRVHRA